MWQDQFERLLEPQRRIQKQIEKYLVPQRQLQEQIEKYLAPQRRLQEQIEKYLAPQRQLQEQMEKYLAPQRRFQEQIDKYLEPQHLLKQKIEKYLNPLGDYLSSPLMAKIAVNNSGMLTLSNEVVSPKIINDTIDSLEKEYSSTGDFLGSFFSLLEKLNESARTVFIYLILPYIISILANITTPIYEDLWRNSQNSEFRSAKKEIIREVNVMYSSGELKDFRFVYATRLNVRVSENIKSEIVGNLHFGKVVKIIRKSKRWSFVEYEDSASGEIKQGWVLSRYLRNFSR